MAKDVGLQAPAGTTAPAGVVAGSGVQVRVGSTLGGSEQAGRIYLFKRSGGLSPGAGESYVNYNFQLLSGAYKTTYKLQDGPNLENTTVSTPFYEVHFGDRWLRDRLRIKAGNASEVDILDRAKTRLVPGNCGRSEDTFDDAEGAFIANRSGPVRAIRSYIGANSGPLSQRDHIFYEQREDVRSFLRVHAIPGPLDYFDYSAAASGMVYANNVNTGGVTIDGTPETPAAGRLTWETVRGPQGALSMVHSLVTDIPNLPSSSYYLDDSTPGGGAETQCTGDAAAYGASGPWLNCATCPTPTRALPRSTRCGRPARSTSSRPARRTGRRARRRRPARSASQCRAFRSRHAPEQGQRTLRVASRLGEIDDQHLVGVAGNGERLEAQRQLPDQRVGVALGPVGLLANVVSSPSTPELGALQRQLPDEVGQVGVVEVRPDR